MTVLEAGMNVHIFKPPPPHLDAAALPRLRPEGGHHQDHHRDRRQHHGDELHRREGLEVVAELRVGLRHQAAREDEFAGRVTGLQHAFLPSGNARAFDPVVVRGGLPGGRRAKVKP